MTSQKNLQQLTMEKDQALADLNSVERSLSDLFRRYENLKGVLEGFKKVLYLGSLFLLAALVPGHSSCAVFAPLCPMLQHRGSPIPCSAASNALALAQRTARSLSSARFLLNEQRIFQMPGEASAGRPVLWLFSTLLPAALLLTCRQRSIVPWAELQPREKQAPGQSAPKTPAASYTPFFHAVELDKGLQHKGEAGSI